MTQKYSFTLDGHYFPIKRKNTITHSRKQIFQIIFPSIYKVNDNNQICITTNDNLDQLMYDNLVSYCNQYKLKIVQVINYLTKKKRYRTGLCDAVYSGFEIYNESIISIFSKMLSLEMIYMAKHILYTIDILNKYHGKSIEVSESELTRAVILASKINDVELMDYFIYFGGCDFRLLNKTSDIKLKNDICYKALNSGHVYLLKHMLNIGADGYRLFISLSYYRINYNKYESFPLIEKIVIKDFCAKASRLSLITTFQFAGIMIFIILFVIMFLVIINN